MKKWLCMMQHLQLITTKCFGLLNILQLYVSTVHAHPPLYIYMYNNISPPPPSPLTHSLTPAHLLKWSPYLKLINTSLTKHLSQACSGECGCHTPVIDADLAIWKERGGITREDFLSGKANRYRGVHYQIIDHVLYREPECMFPAR